jgi:very-short-patch-repair endonuclease
MVINKPIYGGGRLENSTLTIIYNKSSQKEKRRYLRHHMPKAEIILWSALKNKQVLGYKFRRQYSVGSFVLDFYCPRLKLALEVDGESHFSNSAKIYDQERQKYIEEFGIKFLRFINNDIYTNLDGVIEEIIRTIKVLT